MPSFRVELPASPHDVHIGVGLLARFNEMLSAARLDRRRTVIVTDETVGGQYAAPLLEQLGARASLVTVPPGENSKSLATLAYLYEQFARLELDRSSVVVALGGGVIGDLAGFAAATYLRGIALVQAPTTLLAQVDSALGGKTAINLPSGKNLVGAFYQPRAIIADIATLTTLPERTFREGLAEVIKYGAIRDAPFIDWLETAMPQILARDPEHLTTVVERSLRHKAYVVTNDERESGLRQILNFGHTFGHALETASGYGNYFHGEAVAIGMVVASRLSRHYAGLSADDAGRLAGLIARAGLPTRMPDGWRSEEFLSALRHDKKRAGEGIEFVLLDRLGHALLRKLDFDRILAVA
ncbi:MAG TPA: 3-dehydroquinate synthase [Candidatus Binataceae bacterium]|nr:3-dehydroquinate synthase [Candidatus Binataceae bacterium]